MSAEDEARFEEHAARFEAALRAGDEAAAREASAAAVVAAPPEPGPRLRLARAFRTWGRLELASDWYDRARPNCGDSAELLVAAAQVANDLGRLSEAADLYRRLIELHADAYEARNNLGSVLHRQGRLTEATEVLTDALHAHPEVPELWLTLGNVMLDQEDHDKAEAFYRQVLALRPEDGIAWANLGEALTARGQVAAALDCYRRALELRSDDAGLHYNHGVLLLGQGDLARGWDELEWRRDPRFFKYVDLDHGLARWQGESLAGKRILVCAEQGVGDELRFAECFPDLIARAGHCVIECDARLAPFYARSFPSATIHAWTTAAAGNARVRRYGWLKALPALDCYIEAGSLKRHFRRHRSDFPKPRILFRADRDRLAEWRRRLGTLGPGLKVGISWTSGLKSPWHHLHMNALDNWAPVFAVAPGLVHFVSLQYGRVDAEIESAEARFGIRIHRWPDLDLRDDFDGVAALCAGLDHVISRGTAALHVAAGLGVTSQVFDRLPSEFSLGEKVNPFSPRMRVYFRLPDPTWARAMGEIAADLAVLAQAHADRGDT